MEWFLGILLVVGIIFWMQTSKEKAIVANHVIRISDEISSIYLDYKTIARPTTVAGEDAYFLGFLCFYIQRSLTDCGLRPETIDAYSLRNAVMDNCKIPFYQGANDEKKLATWQMERLLRAHDPEFTEGLDHATIVIGFRQRLLKPELMQDPIIIKALASAKEQGLDNSYENISKVLMKIFFERNSTFIR